MANYLQNQGLDSDKMYSESTTGNTENTQPFIWPTCQFTAGPVESFKSWLGHLYMMRKIYPPWFE